MKNQKTSLVYHSDSRTKTDEQSRSGEWSHKPRKSVQGVYDERSMVERIHQTGKF